MTFFEATPGLLETKVFWNKGYDVIILDHDVTNKILSHDSNYIVDVVIWPKFGCSSVSTREVIITSILQGFDRKNHLFFEGWEKYLAEWRTFFLLDTRYFMFNYIFSFSSLEVWRWWESVDNFSLLDYSMESFMISPSYFRMWDIVAVFSNRYDSTYPVNICLFKVNNRKSRKSCEICLKLQVEQVNVTWEEPIGGSHIFWISALTKSFISFEMKVNKKLRA